MRYSIPLSQKSDVRLRLTARTVSVLLTCLLLAAASAVLAQSGRKQKKTAPEPPPQGVKAPEKTPEVPKDHSDSDQPTSEKPADKEKTAVSFIVGTGMSDMNLPMSFSSIAREGCLRELRAGTFVNATESINMTRSEAIEVAKKSDKTYVILMELEIDRMTGNDVEVRFTLYEPKTGRQIASGVGYPATQTRGIPLPPLGGSRIEVRIELSARDVAHRVMNKLQVRPGGKFPVKAFEK